MRSLTRCAALRRNWRALNGARRKRMRRFVRAPQFFVSECVVHAAYDDVVAPAMPYAQLRRRGRGTSSAATSAGENRARSVPMADDAQPVEAEQAAVAAEEAPAAAVEAPAAAPEAPAAAEAPAPEPVAMPRPPSSGRLSASKSRPVTSEAPPVSAEPSLNTQVRSLVSSAVKMTIDVRSPAGRGVAARSQPPGAHRTAAARLRGASRRAGRPCRCTRVCCAWLTAPRRAAPPARRPPRRLGALSRQLGAPHASACAPSRPCTRNSPP